ncbi:hypothetical protein F4808DRAFT_157724 [Astrocystis sublimbata]|nr:hypothetical protein F4808DRAFT_157724 [Astrocystis sublimbata]
MGCASALIIIIMIRCCSKLADSLGRYYHIQSCTYKQDGKYNHHLQFTTVRDPGHIGRHIHAVQCQVDSPPAAFRQRKPHASYPLSGNRASRDYQVVDQVDLAPPTICGYSDRPRGSIVKSRKPKTLVGTWVVQR